MIRIPTFSSMIRHDDAQIGFFFESSDAPSCGRKGDQLKPMKPKCS